MTRRIGVEAVPLEMHSSASVGRVRAPGAGHGDAPNAAETDALAC